MRMIQLSDSHNNDKPVYVNADQIIKVGEVNDYTWVTTTGLSASGGSIVVVTQEKAYDVMQKIMAR